MSRLQSKKGR